MKGIPHEVNCHIHHLIDLFFYWFLEYLSFTLNISVIQYNWPSISVGSTNEDRKYSEKRLQKSSKEQNLSLHHGGDYLHSIYVV